MWGNVVYLKYFLYLCTRNQCTMHNVQCTKGNKNMYGLGILGDKIESFTQRVVDASKYLKDKREYSLADQLFRSGTSIGANCSEASAAVSRADFANKLGIALKEANETCYWIDVMFMAKLINAKTYESFKNDAVEICKLLTTIQKNARTNINAL